MAISPLPPGLIRENKMEKHDCAMITGQDELGCIDRGGGGGYKIQPSF